MSERKLASIRRVTKIDPIEGANAIELAHIDGWQCVVKKGDFKDGDLGVYFEIDSLLPCIEPFLFLESRGRKKIDDGSEGYRLRTIKLRGVLSQGLLMPIHLFENILPELDIQTIRGNEDFFVNTDLTDSLGIKKYEPPVPAQLVGQVKGTFPSFIRRTDQERIQNLPEYFKRFADMKFEISEKIDGTSATYYINNGVYGICSRNMEMKVNEENESNLYVKIGKILEFDKVLPTIGRNLAIQGEIAGPGIQKNKLQLKEVKLFVFDIYDIDEQKYLTPDERYMTFLSLQNLLSQNGIFNHVPILPSIMALKEFNGMDAILAFASGKSSENPNCEREGIVFKSCDYHYGQIISFKAISNTYLLGED